MVDKQSKDYKDGFQAGHTEAWSGGHEADYSRRENENYFEGYLDGVAFGEKENQEKEEKENERNQIRLHLPRLLGRLFRKTRLKTCGGN